MRFLVFILMLISYPSIALDVRGYGVYKKLDTDLFMATVSHEASDSKLWLGADTELTLAIRVVADKISVRRFQRIWVEGLAINLTAQELRDNAAYVSQFTESFKGPLLVNDDFKISNESGQTEVSLNSILLTTIASKNFANILLKSWIGKFPQSPRFKAALLNEVNPRDDSRATEFQPIANLSMAFYSAERASSIQQWLEVGTKNEDSRNKASPQTEIKELKVLPLAVAEKLLKQQRLEKKNQKAAISKESGSKETGSEETGSEETGSEEAILKKISLAKQLEEQRIKDQAARAELAQKRKYQKLLEQQLAQSTFFQSILRQANQRVKYPESALRRRQEGRVSISIEVDRNGGLIAAKPGELSEIKAFNRAAMKAARAAAPYPEAPKSLSGERFEFTIPFKFLLAKS